MKRLRDNHYLNRLIGLAGRVFTNDPGLGFNPRSRYNKGSKNGT